MYAQYSCGSGKASIHDVDNCDKGYYVVFVDDDGQCEIDESSIYQTLEYAVENAAILAEGESRKVFVCWGGDAGECPEKPPTRNIEPKKVANDDKTPPTLTAADHVVVFESDKRAGCVAYVAAHYNRAAILVRNLEGETHVIKEFETKKAAIEAKNGAADNHQLSVVTRNDSTHHVSFYNIITAAHAITSPENQDDLVDLECQTKQHLKGVFGKFYAKIATPESQPVIQEIPESQEVVELPSIPIKISFGEARKLIKLTKNHPDTPIYAIVVNADVVSDSGINLKCLYKYSKVGVYGDSPAALNGCRLLGFDNNEGQFRFQHVGFSSVTYDAAIDVPRVKHPSGKGWIYFDLPKGFDPLTPCDFIAIDDAYDLDGDEYSLEFGDGDDNVIDFNKPIRVYGIDKMWGGVRREKVCICRHPDLDECDDDDDGFKPPRICQPIEPWLHIDNDGYEGMYKYAY